MKNLISLFLAGALVLASCDKDDDPIAVGSVSLDKTTLTLTVGQTANLTATVLPENAHDKTVAWQSSNTAVATVSDAGLVTAISSGSATITAAAGGKSATCVIRVIPAEGVLINGLVWAKTNVDAPGTFAANPEDAGMFYQGNSKTGWSTTDPMTSSPAGQKWGAAAPVDSWDAANDPCPEGWRVPTLEELKKLVGADNVGSEWTTRNGINGREFKDNSSGNTVFFPAVGYRTTNAELKEIGYFGEYWTSTIDGLDASCNLYFDSTSAAADGIISYLSYAFSVRCVLKE